jgi:hypothetical protein
VIRGNSPRAAHAYAERVANLATALEQERQARAATRGGALTVAHACAEKSLGGRLSVAA